MLVDRVTYLKLTSLPPYIADGNGETYDQKTSKPHGEILLKVALNTITLTSETMIYDYQKKIKILDKKRI
jgi:hypothetical protein